MSLWLRHSYGSEIFSLESTLPNVPSKSVQVPMPLHKDEHGMFEGGRCRSRADSKTLVSRTLPLVA